MPACGEIALGFYEFRAMSSTKFDDLEIYGF